MRNKIEYAGHTFTASDIKSVNIRLASSLISRQLEANTITAVVETDDESIQNFVRNTPMRYYYRDRQRFLAYVQSVDRVGPRAYQIYGTSAIGLLMERMHVGGLYTGQTAESVIREIVGNIPFSIKSNLKGIKIHGWLPYVKPPEKSARDNLVQVLFALGAALKTDLDGVLRIQHLWDGISGEIPWDHIYEDGAKAQRSGAVSSVSVTEHSYVQGGESKKLFEGEAIAGDIITFQEPMYNLSSTGFSILERGVNYAKLSAGTGTLTGTAYIHNTRQINKIVTPGAAENLKSVEDATLVSFFNSNSVADSLAEYYKHTETINCGVVLGNQSPGDILNVYHPFTKMATPACVESLDISASGILKASIKALVGYIPPQTESVEYFDHRQMFTSSGWFSVPAGVHTIRAVLIGGGSGGSGGKNGTAGTRGGTAELRGNSGSKFGAKGTPGSGGAAGSAGAGGKVSIRDIAVNPGDSIYINIGAGGPGGAAGSNGGPGGATTISVNGTTYSSNSGSSSSAGYRDPVTGQVFAKPGTAGQAGGKGGEGSGNETERGSDGASVGSSAGGKGGRYQSFVKDDVFGWSPNTTYVEWYLLPCGGGGAAYGAPGGDAPGKNTGNPPNSGGAGANAGVSSTYTDSIGGGGNGGHGGGGGGAGGGGAIWMRISGGSGSSGIATQEGAPGGPGGKGSAGSQGASGGAIFFYAEEKKAPAGSPLDRNKKIFMDKFKRILVT